MGTDKDAPPSGTISSQHSLITFNTTLRLYSGMPMQEVAGICTFRELEHESSSAHSENSIYT